MTNEEAMKTIETALTEIDEWKCPTKYALAMALRKGKEVLEKQIPKKLIFEESIFKIHHEEHTFVDVRCPCCGKVLYKIVDGCEFHKGKFNCCSDCGQKLDWRDES